MWSLRTRSIWRWNRLEDFNAANPADEDPMRIGRNDHMHGAVSSSEKRGPTATTQRCDYLGIGAAHACVDLQRAKAEIEEDGGAILRAQRIAVGANFGEGRSRVHGARRLREAQRHALIPGARGERLGSNRAQVCSGC